MAEIQKPADQAEQKPDAGVKSPDNLGKHRAVTGDQVTEADALRTNKFNTFGDMKAYADSNPLLIDMGDGTETSSKGTQVAWKPESLISPHKENPDQFVDHAAFKTHVLKSWRWKTSSRPCFRSIRTDGKRALAKQPARTDLIDYIANWDSDKT